jgi:LysR family nitrogen assimilation transcriptional regulator
MHKAPPFDLFRLQVFLTVVQHKSLTAAGLQLRLPQPIVSRHVAHLENDFGGKLFDRHGRGVKLSELGKLMFPKIENLIRDAHDLADEIDKDAASPSGEVKLGILPSLRELLTVPLFFHMRKAFPRIRLSVNEGSGHLVDQWLANAEIDIGLPYRYGRSADQHVDQLLSVKSYLIGPAGDAITRQPSVDFSALQGLPLILPTSSSNFRLKLDQIARQRQISLDVVLQTESGQVQRDIVAQHGGYTVSTWHAVSDRVQRGELQASEILEPCICRSLSLGFSSTKSASQAARVVALAIKKIVASREVRRTLNN